MTDYVAFSKVTLYFPQSNVILRKKYNVTFFVKPFCGNFYTADPLKKGLISLKISCSNLKTILTFYSRNLK